MLQVYLHDQHFKHLAVCCKFIYMNVQCDLHQEKIGISIRQTVAEVQTNFLISTSERISVAVKIISFYNLIQMMIQFYLKVKLDWNFQHVGTQNPVTSVTACANRSDYRYRFPAASSYSIQNTALTILPFLINSSFSFQLTFSGLTSCTQLV